MLSVMSKTVYLLVVGGMLVLGTWFLFRDTLSFSQDGTPSATSTPAQVSVQEPTVATSSATAVATTTISSQKPTAVYKQVMTTMFWVGEGADASNDYISNDQSYWDEEWQVHYGGVDGPDCRDGYLPCDFVPQESPFYVALPYGEYDTETGELKASVRQVPWYQKDAAVPLLKNRWVEVSYRGRTCFGQWEDVGPNEENDFAYVFGSATVPRNTFDAKAGLDVSPALWECLGLVDNDTTSWRFVEERAVPEGPWRETVTTSGISWE